jgi:hypothetical protein
MALYRADLEQGHRHLSGLMGGHAEGAMAADNPKNQEAGRIDALGQYEQVHDEHTLHIP